MSEQMYVASENLMRDRKKGRGRGQIVAGTPFSKDDIVEATFDALVAAGCVSRSDGKTVSMVNSTGHESLTDNVPNRTPSATIDPGKVKKKPAENLDDAGEAEKETVKKALTKLGIKFAANSRLDTLKEKLEKAQKVGKVWNANPEDLQDLPLHQLMSMYKETCVKYSRVVEKFDTKELLIEKMSSEFGP